MDDVIVIVICNAVLDAIKLTKDYNHEVTLNIHNRSSENDNQDEVMGDALPVHCCAKGSGGCSEALFLPSP